MKLSQVVREELHVAAGAILEHERESARGADARNRRRRKAKARCLRQAGSALLLMCCLNRLELLFALLRSSHGFSVTKKNAVVLVCTKLSRLKPTTLRAYSTPASSADLLDLSRDRLRALQRGRIRQLQIDIDVALILVRQKARRQPRCRKMRASDRTQ